jgi:hypothetical protein
MIFSIKLIAGHVGRRILLSTPFGKRGFFYDTWVNGLDAEWLKIKITALECPRISGDFLEQEKRVLGKFWYDQESDG